MATPLAQVMTSGVYIECLDPAGNTVGQVIYPEWQGRPLPAVGDQLSLAVRSPVTGLRERVTGEVESRYFDLQRDGDQPCVWVRVEVVVRGTSRPARQEAVSALSSRRARTFSKN